MKQVAFLNARIYRVSKRFEEFVIRKHYKYDLLQKLLVAFNTAGLLEPVFLCVSEKKHQLKGETKQSAILEMFFFSVFLFVLDDNRAIVFLQ